MNEVTCGFSREKLVALIRARLLEPVLAKAGKSGGGGASEAAE